ncbi:type VI secretion system contractile sheath large subunit [Marinobacterium stanieri]|uniref:type VI secretion system contractile sheath large subunit n=1 Tax=Marinobacterium stanieri TaxID=49186 RepID=UPI003A8CEF6A
MDNAWLQELIDAVGHDVLRQKPTKLQILHSLNQQIAHIDQLLQRQVDEVLHHPDFQALESAWSGCRYLLEQLAFDPQVKVKLLDVSWRDLHRDLTRAIDVEESDLFAKVYSTEFGTPGGEPFGVMLCNHDVSLTPATHGVDDLRVLQGLAAVGAASFTPFIFNASPSLLDLDDFSGLHTGLDLDTTYRQARFIKWNALREQEDVRFIGLALPGVYIRKPYTFSRLRTDRFVYREQVTGERDYLKVGAIFPLGAVIARCFMHTGWLAEITGKRYFGGGVVPSLNIHTSDVDAQPVISSQVMIPDALERSLSDLGFIPLCYSAHAGPGVFYSTSSLQRPTRYDTPQAQINARYSAMLQYVLCTSRFAHFLKVLVRDKVGSFSTTDECQHFLQRWIMQYVMSTDEASEVLLAKYPLREARVQVSEPAGGQGAYQCTVHLKPHFQLESIETSIQFSAEVVTNRMTGS